MQPQLKRPRRWSKPGTVEVFLDRVEAPHRAGAGNLWDIDKFWVQVGWESRGCKRSHVFAAAAQGENGDESEGAAVGVVCERLVLPLLCDEDSKIGFKASLHEADVVCRLNAEVGSCMVPLDRARNSLIFPYALKDWRGVCSGLLYLAVSLPEFPDMVGREQVPLEPEAGISFSLEDFWVPLLQFFSCECETSSRKEKLAIVRKASVDGRDDHSKRKPTSSSSTDGHLGPMDGRGASLAEAGEFETHSRVLMPYASLATPSEFEAQRRVLMPYRMQN